MKSKYGFTMVEIVIAMIILVIGFFPIYNLFKQGSGTAVNNIQETVATNYASDLINFCKDLRYTDMENKNIKNEDLKEKELEAFFKKFTNLKHPPIDEKDKDIYKRSLIIKRYNTYEFSWPGIQEWFDDLINNRKKVPSYYVEVKVTFPRMGGRNNDDDVTLYSLILD